MTNFDFDMDSKPRRTKEQVEDTNGALIQENLQVDETAVKRKTETDTTNGKNTDFKKPKPFFTKKKSDSDDESADDEDVNEDKNGSSTTLYTSKAINQQPGHTGFLTFATLLHKKYLNI